MWKEIGFNGRLWPGLGMNIEIKVKRRRESDRQMPDRTTEGGAHRSKVNPRDVLLPHSLPMLRIQVHRSRNLGASLSTKLWLIRAAMLQVG